MLNNQDQTGKLDLLFKISSLLYDFFVTNPGRYAKQLPDGNYRTIYKRLHPAKILHSLKNENSMLTYQEAQGYIKWVCLDFDIKKPNQDKYNEYFSYLLDAVSKTIDYITTQDIHNLLECSGRRGYNVR